MTGHNDSEDNRREIHWAVLQMSPDTEGFETQRQRSTQSQGKPSAAVT